MKHLNTTYLLILLFGGICLFSLYAFDQDDQEEESYEEIEAVPIPPLVQQKLDEKIAHYQKTIMDKCRERAYEAAEKYIDSLVAAELKFQTRDTFKFPAKPIRPQLNEPIILNDSTEIEPIIKAKDSIQ